MMMLTAKDARILRELIDSKFPIEIRPTAYMWEAALSEDGERRARRYGYRLVDALRAIGREDLADFVGHASDPDRKASLKL